MNLGPNIYSELISLLCALICFSRLKNSFMQWLVPFLAVTLFVELYSHAAYANGKPTLHIYTTFDTITIVFYTFFFTKFAIKNSLKKVFITTTVVHVLFTIAYYSFYTVLKPKLPDYYLFVISGTQMVLFACLLFYQYLKTDELDNIPNHKSGLWLASGIIIFYSGVTLVLSLLYYILENNLKIGGEYLYNFVPRYLSIILYGCISISMLVWKRPLQK
jgi:hypothetical protein